LPAPYREEKTFASEGVIFYTTTRRGAQSPVQSNREGRLMAKMLTLHLTDLERKASVLLHAVNSMQDAYGTTDPARTDFEAIHNLLMKMRSLLHVLRIECEQTGGQ
jgi:hypothetical protein